MPSREVRAPKGAVVAAALLLVGGLACVPPVPSNDEVVDYPPTTAMGLIQDRGVLRVGIEADAYPLGAPDDRTGSFTAAFGTEIAESLGVEPQIVAVPRDQLLRGIDSGALDIAFPLSPITEEAVSDHAFSDPWWVGHQRLLVVGDEAPLGASVCDAPEEITGIPVRRLWPDVERVIPVSDPRDCLEPLTEEEASAASGPDVLLLALLASLPDGARLEGEAQTTAGYGVMMSRDALGLNGFVDLVLREIDGEGRWEQWYREYVTPLTGAEPPGIPLMTLEEAAALHPK